MAFHNSGEIISVASGSQLRIWKWKENYTDNFISLNNLKRDKESKNNNIKTNELDSDSFSDTNFAYIVHPRNIRATFFHPNGEILFAAAPDSPKQASPLTPCRYEFIF